MQIAGQTFLVSGGASGLGRAVVEMLALHGGRVVIADVNESAGTAVAATLGDAARFVRTDVTSEEDVQRAVATAREVFGGLQGAISTAGIGTAEKLVGKAGPHALESFTRTIGINLVGTFNVMRLAAQVMVSGPAGPGGERGVVINTASIAAFEGQIGQVAYAASKGGIVAMTLPAARELARSGVRVVAIAPGIFDTPLLAGLPEAARESLGLQVPFPPRLGQPSEFAALVKHVLENQMLNGDAIRLDGALRMAPK